MFLCWFKHLKNFADMMSWKITTEEYIQRAKAVHGDKYGYELTEYVDRKILITITCKKHGPIKVNPWTHIKCGSGCIECARDEKLRTAPKDTESFIEKSIKIHGDKYDYSKVDYKGYKTPVEIICPIHGSFWMKPFVHLQPTYQQGCPKCGIEKRVKERTGNKDEFIAKSNALYNFKYKYDKVEYVNRMTPVIITCPVHGDFLQKPHAHLDGHECAKCTHPHIYGRTRDELLTEFYSIHQNSYSYPDLPERCNEHHKIKISCPKHGMFKQTVKYHLKGGGCPICCNSKHANALAVSMNEENISFEREKTFPWLRRRIRGRMRLDFYLPDYNVGIEYQGAMHFGIHKNNKYTMTKEDYEDLFDRDRVKYKLCKEHGIRILYFCYNKEWVPDNYIDHVYTTVKELLAELERIKSL